MLTKESFVAIHHLLPFIKPMKDSLQSLYDLLSSKQVTYNTTRTQTYTKQLTLEDLSNERYIDESLKHDIIRLTHCTEVQFTTGQVRFHILFHHHSKESLETLVPVLQYVLSLTTLLGPHTINKVTMNYYLLDSTRVLNDDFVLDKTEVNGGSCMNMNDSCEISVWRKEEIVKVSIHELIHGLMYDYHEDTPELVSHYLSKYKLTSDKINSFEGYTELFAELIHCYLLSHIYTTYNSSIDCYTLFQAFVGLEIQFSQLQASKVLNLKQREPDMNQHTNVLAYYIIKLELYQSLRQTLAYFERYNDSIIKITDTDRYFDYLTQLRKVKGKKYKVTGYLEITTRMTCLELNLFE